MVNDYKEHYLVTKVIKGTTCLSLEIPVTRMILRILGHGLFYSPQYKQA
jgi:hypothetical protein